MQRNNILFLLLVKFLYLLFILVEQWFFLMFLIQSIFEPCSHFKLSILSFNKFRFIIFLSWFWTRRIILEFINTISNNNCWDKYCWLWWWMNIRDFNWFQMQQRSTLCVIWHLILSFFIIRIMRSIVAIIRKREILTLLFYKFLMLRIK